MMFLTTKNERQDYVIGRFVQARNIQFPNRFQHVATSISNKSLEDGVIHDSDLLQNFSIEVSEVRLENESVIGGNFDKIASRILEKLPIHFHQYELDITPPDFDDFCVEDSENAFEDEHFPFANFFSSKRRQREIAQDKFVNAIANLLCRIDEGELASLFSEYSSNIIWFGFLNEQLTIAMGLHNPFSFKNSFALLIHKNGKHRLRIRNSPNDRDDAIFVDLARAALRKKINKEAKGDFLVLYAGDIWTLPAFSNAKRMIVDELKQCTTDQIKFKEIWYWHNWVDAGDSMPNLQQIF